ncbi:MAG: CoA pyrophosphatase [Bacteroidales bacterium]|nr:CoA pyrophosphatase [Bacteroidales bacterium]
MNEFIAQLKEKLSRQLPGADYQLKLEPGLRAIEMPGTKRADAAVLLLIFPESDRKLQLVLMKRQVYDGPHSGQICFPGGKAEPGDKSVEDTALRETAEELGICTQNIEVIGRLTEIFIPVSGYMVYPVVGLSHDKPIFKIDKGEVDYCLTISLDDLVRTPVKETTWRHKGLNVNIPYFDIDGEMVWGATAMILSEFIEVIKR